MEEKDKNQIEYMGYRITPLGTRLAYRIQARGSGSIPTCLMGEYTTVKSAKHGIDLSYAAMSSKGRAKKNDKETSSPSD